ncbi:hypothetical protein OTSUT76_3111 [Orientia tsutsugamushi str. UT76]|nr:hypothetical protein OTSUT76_3111 [Orientia tsutsugamushi str. UT76]
MLEVAFGARVFGDQRHNNEQVRYLINSNHIMKHYQKFKVLLKKEDLVTTDSDVKSLSENLNANLSDNNRLDKK